MPASINIQLGLYYPLWWLLGMLHIPATVTVVTLIQIIHVLFAGVGILFLARSRGLRWPWPLVAAIAYTFFGGFYGNSQHADVVRGLAYVPWLLWALTIPREGKQWKSLLAVPPAMWLFATGAYPGQTVAALLMGGVYGLTGLWQARKRLEIRRLALGLMLAVISGGLIVAAAVLPYVQAERAGLLYRPSPPTAVVRAAFSIQPVDLLGLYQNTFAWRPFAHVQVLWVGVAVLMGLTGLRLRDLRRHAPLVATGLAAATLMMLPSWLPAGRVMARLEPVFPSRFPPFDYKGFLACALVVLAAVGWRKAGSTFHSRVLAGVGGLALVLGLLLAPRVTQVPPVRWPWLTVGLIVLLVGLALWPARGKTRFVVPALCLLIVVEGFALLPGLIAAPGVSLWKVPRTAFYRADLHDRAARSLRDQVRQPPARRPPRVASGDPFIPYLGGDISNALGYLGGDYYLYDYLGTVLKARWEVMKDDELRDIMLKQWTAWTWSCKKVNCARPNISIPPGPWTVSGGVSTTRYGISSIDYQVDLSERTFFLENEFAFPGWKANKRDIRPVVADGIFRGWILPRGRYSFTASYVEPGRKAQLTLGFVALLLWLGLRVTQGFRRDTLLMESGDS